VSLLWVCLRLHRQLDVMLVWVPLIHSFWIVENSGCILIFALLFANFNRSNRCGSERAAYSTRRQRARRRLKPTLQYGCVGDCEGGNGNEESLPYCSVGFSLRSRPSLPISALTNEMPSLRQQGRHFIDVNIAPLTVY